LNASTGEVSFILAVFVKYLIISVLHALDFEKQLKRFLM